MLGRPLALPASLGSIVTVGGLQRVHVPTRDKSDCCITWGILCQCFPDRQRGSCIRHGMRQRAISFILPFESIATFHAGWLAGQGYECLTALKKHQAVLETRCKQLALGPHVCMRGRGKSVKLTCVAGPSPGGPCCSSCLILYSCEGLTSCEPHRALVDESFTRGVCS